MSNKYGRNGVMKQTSNDTKKKIINYKDKSNKLRNTISVFTHRELQDCVEKIHYKIKANENACLMAKNACKDAEKAVLIANKKIKTAIALRRVLDVSKKINVFTSVLIYNMNNLTFNLRLSVQHNQINYLYQIIQFLLVKQDNTAQSLYQKPYIRLDPPCSTKSVSPPITPLFPSSSDSDSKVNSFTNSSVDTPESCYDDTPESCYDDIPESCYDDTPEKNVCFDFFLKKKGKKIYDISHTKKKKKNNFLKILIIRIYYYLNFV